MKRTSFSWLSMLPIAAVLIAAAPPASAQYQAEPLAKPAPPSVDTNEPSTSFTLQPKDGRQQFHMGEAIPLQLVFRSTAKGILINPDAHETPGSRYGYRGAVMRAASEEWHLDPPDGAVDPLRDYTQSGGRGFRLVAVTAEPTIVELDLNDWLRFERPGRYRLYDVTGRVRGLPAEKEHRQGYLISNTIEFEILPPDSQWEEQTLQEARRRLDTASSFEAKVQAIRTLRFLGTEKAALELVARLPLSNANNVISGSNTILNSRVPLEKQWSPEEQRLNLQEQLVYGLYGSPHRAAIVQELRGRLVAPGHPVYSNLFNLLVDLQTKALVPTPPTNYSSFEVGGYERYEAAQRLWQETQRRIQLENWQTLRQAVPLKQAAAQDASVATLITAIPYTRADRARAEWVEPIQQLQALTVELFPHLSTSTRVKAFLNWPALRTPAMIPNLQRLIAQPPAGGEQLRAWALAALHDIDPAAARPLLLREISYPGPGVNIKLLSLLPDATLPSLDRPLIANLARTIATPGSLHTPLAKLQARLIERYASPAAATQVRKLYDKITTIDGAEVRAALLAYYFRTEPATAVKLTEAALDAPGDSQYRQTLLWNTAYIHMTPELERLLIAHINDRDIPIASYAISLLGRLGSAAAEAPLWQRLEQFREQWQDRAKELETDTPESRLQHTLELSLVNALRDGPAWNSFKAGLERMQKLVVTNAARAVIDSDLHQSTIIHLTYDPGPGDINLLADGYTSVVPTPVRWQLLWYSGTTLESLKARIAQFPAGTIFTNGNWQIDTLQPAQDRARLSGELSAYVEQRGMRLV